MNTISNEICCCEIEEKAIQPYLTSTQSRNQSLNTQKSFHPVHRHYWHHYWL